MAGSDSLPSESALLAAIATHGAGADHGDLLSDGTLPETKWMGDIKSAIADIDHIAWTSYTPVLTAATTNPTLGTGPNGAVQYGKYLQLGNFVYVYFDVTFATTGINGGSGVYSVSLPVNCNTDGTAAGISSEELGTGLLYRGATNDSFGPAGALQKVAWHAAFGVNDKVLAVLPQPPPYDFQVAEGTNADAVLATTQKDITGAAVTITVKQANANYRLVGTTPWYTSTNNTTMYLQLREGSTTLRQAPSPLATAGTSITNQNTARVEYVLVNPTLGSHTYKLTAFADQACTIAYDNSNKQYPRIEAQQLPYSGSPSGEYVGSGYPWAWGDSVANAQMWGRLRYEAA